MRLLASPLSNRGIFHIKFLRLCVLSCRVIRVSPRRLQLDWSCASPHSRSKSFYFHLLFVLSLLECHNDDFCRIWRHHTYRTTWSHRSNLLHDVLLHSICLFHKQHLVAHLWSFHWWQAIRSEHERHQSIHARQANKL